jgi:ferrochelatase
MADVLPGPSWLKKLMAPLVARSRASSVMPKYELIGWSPLVETNGQQVDALRTALGADALPIARGMMFTPPEIRDGLRDLRDQGVDSLIALPMFPHYSLATTGAAFSFLYEAMEQEGMADMPVHHIPAYYTHPRYLNALASTIRTGIENTPGDEELHLLFSPHGLPVSWVTRHADPYPYQVRESARQVIDVVGWTGPWHLGWQSRVGPVRWLSPSTPQALTRLATEGVKRVCVVPVSFTSEHIETLEEIDLQFGEHARAAGIEHFARAPALGCEPEFIGCLGDLVRDALTHFKRYQCVRCLHPKPDAHRRQAQCPNCQFTFPKYLREGS